MKRLNSNENINISNEKRIIKNNLKKQNLKN